MPRSPPPGTRFTSRPARASKPAQTSTASSDWSPGEMPAEPPACSSRNVREISVARPYGPRHEIQYANLIIGGFARNVRGERGARGARGGDYLCGQYKDWA